jgi:hypothetical protein
MATRSESRPFPQVQQSSLSVSIPFLPFRTKIPSYTMCIHTDRTRAVRSERITAPTVVQRNPNACPIGNNPPAARWKAIPSFKMDGGPRRHEPAHLATHGPAPPSHQKRLHVQDGDVSLLLAMQTDRSVGSDESNPTLPVRTTPLFATHTISKRSRSSDRRMCS